MSDKTEVKDSRFHPQLAVFLMKSWNTPPYHLVEGGKGTSWEGIGQANISRVGEIRITRTISEHDVIALLPELRKIRDIVAPCRDCMTAPQSDGSPELTATCAG